MKARRERHSSDLILALSQVRCYRLLGWGFGGLLGGVLADYIGRKRMMIIAVLAYSVMTVGAFGYAVTLLAFAALYAAGTPYAIAAGAAYLVSNALMYVGNRYFTFRLGHEGFWAAYARYLAVGLLVAGLNASLLTGLVEGAGVDPRIGQAAALLLVTPPAFLLFKRWTFKLQSV